ncbi:MAG: hypothetical protein L0H94_06790 [Nitrospira sp.]|nr:hypothetical protein [Nitrospira sp.]
MKKQYGKEWRVQWERAKAAAKFYSRKTRFNTNLFAIEPARKVPHRMMKDGFWFAMSDTKNYFARQSRSPHWNIVQTMFYPISEQSHGYAQSEYTKRKKFLGRFDAEIRLERLVSLYGRFQPVIHKVIESGTPLWAPPHREETQEILNRLKPDEILDIMPWHSSLTRQTLRLSQHGIEMKEA